MTILEDLEQCTVKATSCDIDLLQQCIEAVSHDVLLSSDSLADLEHVKAFTILWVGCECHKVHSLKGWAPHLWGVLQVLGEKSHRGEVVPVGAFLKFHKDRRWTGLGHGR